VRTLTEMTVQRHQTFVLLFIVRVSICTFFVLLLFLPSKARTQEFPSIFPEDVKAHCVEAAPSARQVAVTASTPDTAINALAAASDSQAIALPDTPSAYPQGESSSRGSAPSNTMQSGNSLQPLASPRFHSEKFNLRASLVQSLEMTVFYHAWRAAFDPSLRYQLAHKPFFHDWFASYTDYHMDRWNDGDSFLVNDVGHPLEGATYGRVFLQNNPKSFVPIGRHNGYWKSRLLALAWMTAWSAQFEVGPLSETAIGNQGGYTYVNGCGTYKYCLNNPKYPDTPTNNTGWTDFIATPTVGLAWILGEDTIDRFIVTPIARQHRVLGGRILRSALEPSRSFAALFAGKFPWMLPAPENNFVVSRRPKPPTTADPNEVQLQHWEIGTQYTNLSLPVLKEGCPAGCRVNLSGVGFNFDYKLTRDFGLDSTLNFLPGQNGTKALMQGQFGAKMGERWKHWGLFAKVRPGFIYYGSAMPGGGSTTPTHLTRFAWDFGCIVEVYAHRNATLRLDVGTTMVRYLANYPDPRMSELGSVLSNQYYVNQGNFQLSTAYVFRF
jgi:hypothetical protein